MVRVKKPLKLIEGEKHRNATFLKRRVVIKKKTMELSKLCDIATLLVCYGPRGQLDTWPEEPLQARRIIHHYRSLRAMEVVTHRYDVATFFEGQLKKLRADLERKRSSWLEGQPAGCLEPLVHALDSKLAAIDERLGHTSVDEEVGGHGRGEEIEEAYWWGAAPAEANAAGHRGGGGGYVPFNGGLPPSATPILDVQPVRSLGDLSWMVKTEKCNSKKGLQGHAAWKLAPHFQLQRSGTPSTIGNPPPEPYPLVGGGLPFMSAASEVQPVQSSQSMDLSRVMLEEYFRSRGKRLKGRADDAGAAGWEAPHDLQRSVEMPHACLLPTANPFISPPPPPPPIPEHDHFSLDVVDYLDPDPFFSSPFSCMDFAALDAGACTSSASDPRNPTTTVFPLLSSDGGCGGALRDWNVPSFDQPLNGAGQYGLSLRHPPTRSDTVAAPFNQMNHQAQELYGADQYFFYGGHTTATTSLQAETTIWPSFALQDQPPAPAGWSTSDRERAAALISSRDDSWKFMPPPSGAKRPYE